jgi:hypothetical protein
MAFSDPQGPSPASAAPAIRVRMGACGFEPLREERHLAPPAGVSRPDEGSIQDDRLCASPRQLQTAGTIDEAETPISDTGGNL